MKNQVWYTVLGTGNLMNAKLSGVVCERQGNSGPASQITVLEGATCSGLQCTDVIQGGCQQDILETTTRWFSNVGETYYLYVQSSTSTIFDLIIEEISPDVPDSCNNATKLDGTRDTVVGSTGNATADDLGSCSNSATPGVFYLVDGTGTDLFVSTCNKGTNFATNVDILNGGCENFGCVDSTTVSCDGTRSITYWSTVPGEQYLVYVHGNDDLEPSSGRFNLTIGEGVQGAENDFCPGAVELEIPSAAVGATIDATIDEVDFCENEGKGAPGVWYSTRGSGNPLTASLCGGSTDYDTQIYVYTGSCGSLQCIGSNDDSCGSRSAVTWESQADEVYYILVSGFGSSVGNFEITISEDL
jgi:hypothetical protein